MVSDVIRRFRRWVAWCLLGQHWHCTYCQERAGRTGVPYEQVFRSFHHTDPQGQAARGV